jgi:predicted MFS family arabinose efflux permease
VTLPERHKDDLAVWLLAFGQMVAYGCLFYSFPALLVSIEADTGWSKPALALGPTVALVVAALAAPVAGRLVDRGWGGELLVGSAVIGALGLAGVGLAQGQGGWLLAWAVTGIAQGAGLYDACFAFLTRRLGRDARAAIIRVTLVAGFASTLTYPGGAWLGVSIGWRGAFWVFAAIQLISGGLANVWGVVRLRRQVRAGARAYEDPPGMLERAMAQRQFWQLGVIFGLIYMTHGMLITFAIPLFQERGLAHGMAVLAASMIGPAQVAGRVVFMAGGARLGLIPATRTVIVGMALGICLLALRASRRG